MNTRLAVLVLLISSAGWGLTWLPLKTLSEMGLDGMHLILIAFTSAALFLAPWLIKDYARWKQSLRLMLMIALAGGFANVTFQTAIYHGDVIRVMILFYMLPVWSVIGGRIFLKEKIDGVRISAVLLCLSGAFVILDIWHTSWHGINWIDLLALAAGLGLAVTNILFRYSQHIPVRSKVASTFIGCSVMMVFVFMLSAPAATLPDNYAATLAAAYGVLWLTLITFGTQWAVTQMEAGKSSIIIVMELVAAVISVALITSAELKLHEMLGGLMVLSAAFLEGSRSEETAIEVV
ncbi:MAG: DMT family transporter [Gammaproteobacteria bacterium]|nr:DMT family transporter [Gammaproteobacteria bacterium]